MSFEDPLMSFDDTKGHKDDKSPVPLLVSSSESKKESVQVQDKSQTFINNHPVMDMISQFHDYKIATNNQI